MANGTKQSQAKDNLGLDDLGNLSGLMDDSGVMLLDIDVDSIDFDAEQPRQQTNPGLTEESIAELAESIAHRGLLSPISVHEGGANEARYVVNHGERRLRACKHAGLETIRAFIDNDHSSTDQVIENIQRNALTPGEIASYIGKQVASGVKKSQVAKMLGKSPGFVSQHFALLSLPESIDHVFKEGRVNDVTILNDLSTLHKRGAGVVDARMVDEETITRETVRQLREEIERPEPPAEKIGNNHSDGGVVDEVGESSGSSAPREKDKPNEDSGTDVADSKTSPKTPSHRTTASAECHVLITLSTTKGSHDGYIVTSCEPTNDNSVVVQLTGEESVREVLAENIRVKGVKRVI